VKGGSSRRIKTGMFSCKGILWHYGGSNAINEAEKEFTPPFFQHGKQRFVSFSGKVIRID